MGWTQWAARALKLHTREDVLLAANQAATRAANETAEALQFSYPLLGQTLSERLHYGEHGVAPLDQNFEKYLETCGLFPWVAACNDVIAQAGAAVPLCLYDGDGNKIEKDPALDRLNRPNPEEGFQAFWTGALLQLGYTGEVYLSAAGKVRLLPWMDPEEIYVLQSDHMAPAYNHAAFNGASAKSELIGYEYVWRQTGINQGKVFRPEEVLFVKMTNPRDPLRGLAPIKKIEPTLNLLWAAMQWNMNYFRNGASPGGIISCLKTGEAGVNRFRKMWHEGFGGTNKVGKWAIFEAEDVEITPLGHAAKDADFLQLMEKCREEIFAVNHCTPLILGLLDQPAEATAAEQQKVFYQQAVMPRNKLLTDALNASAWMLGRKDGGYLGHDYSGVEALQENKLEQANTLVALKGARIITANEARETLEREPLEGGDELDEIPAPFDPFADPGEDDNGDPGDETKMDEKGDEKFARLPARVRASTLRRRAHRLAKAPSRAARWAAHDSRLQPIERAWRKRVTLSFRSMLTSLLDDIDRRTNYGFSAKDSLIRLAGSDKVPPQWGKDPPQISPLEEAKMRENLTPIANSTIRYGAEDMLEEINDFAVPFDVTKPAIKAYVENRLGKRIRSILGTQQDRAAKIVADAAAEGRTIDQLSKDLREAFGRDSVAWSDRIARTESAGLYNKGSVTAMEEEDIETKEWLSSRDAFVRPTHSAADGQVVGIRDNFVLTSGASGPFPGEMGVPEEDINCRCAVTMGNR